MLLFVYFIVAVMQSKMALQIVIETAVLINSMNYQIAKSSLHRLCEQANIRIISAVTSYNIVTIAGDQTPPIKLTTAIFFGYSRLLT